LNPADSDAYYNRGNAYSMLGDYTQAIRDYDQFILLYPEDGSAYFYRGYAYDELGNYEKAKKDFLSAIQYCGDFENFCQLAEDALSALENN